MHTVTSNYKVTKQNGECHSNLDYIWQATVCKQLAPDYYEWPS